MSVMLLPHCHVNTVLTWAVAQACRDSWSDTIYLTGRRLHWPSQTQDIGQILADSNARAYAERYREPSDAEDYRFLEVPSADRLLPGAVATLVDCIEYQCSDLADWETSDAARVLNVIRQMLLKHLPGNNRHAKWSISSAADVAAMVP